MMRVTSPVVSLSDRPVKAAVAYRAGWRRPNGTLVTYAARGLFGSAADQKINRKERKIVAVMNQLVLFLPFLLIMGGFMYFASRRQRRAMQATIDLHDSLQPGDRVHTTSGLEATVVAITEDTVDLEIAPGVMTTWMKLAIRDRILPEDPEDFDEDDDQDESDDPEDSQDSADDHRVTKDS
jgi:preprotein translocase subunit YajC